MVRDLGDAAGQTYPRIEWSVSGHPVRPIGAFRVGMAGSAGLEIGAFRPKFHRCLVRRRRILADFPELEIATFTNMFRCFDISGNPGFARFPGARNRDFRDEVPPF